MKLRLLIGLLAISTLGGLAQAQTNTAIPALTSLSGPIADGDLFPMHDLSVGGTNLRKVSALVMQAYFVSDTAYSSAWNGVLVGASKNAVYDQLHIGDTDDDGKIDVLDNVSAAGFLPVTAGGVPVQARTLTEGLAIDITNPTGAAGDPTIAFDPTELTGNRTFGDGTDASIAWTFNLSGTDPVLTFGTGTLGITGTFTNTGVAGLAGAGVSATTDLNLPAGTTGVSSLRIAHGVAPTAPVNGDIWTTTAGLYTRINGSTVGPLGTGSGGSSSLTSTYVGYGDGSNALTGEAAFAYDATNDRLTVGGITSSLASVFTANAMGALSVDVTKGRNQKTIAADSTLTFSATPATGTVFWCELTNSDTAAHVITYPSSFSYLKGTTSTSFVIPASGRTVLYWLYNGSIYLLSGESPAIDNFAATTAPGVGDDTLDGYAAGSVWYDATANIFYIAESVAAGAAVWTELVSKTATQTETNKTFVAPVLGAATATSINGAGLSGTAAVTVSQATVLNRQSSTGLPVEFCVAASDETTALTAGTGKVTFRAPYAFTLTELRASVNTAPTGSTILVDVNESGTTVISTKIMIDATEKTSQTAATPYVISDSAIADDAEISVDFDQVGSTIAGAGLKVWIKGYR